MPAIRTSRKYQNFRDDQLLEFLGGVIIGFTGNPNLPTPPFNVAAMTAVKNDFEAAIVNSKQGGKADRALKNIKRQNVVDKLNSNASYVDTMIGGQLDAILASGYQAVSTNRTPTILNAPQVRKVKAPQSGQLKVLVKGDPNARSYIGRIRAVGGTDFGPAISFAGSRKILFDGLVSGTKYIIQLCAVGGSTGQSDWAETGPNMAL